MKTHTKLYQSNFILKSVIINSTQKKIWEKISNIVGLQWVENTKQTVCRSMIKHGVGAVREITFNDGNKVKEIIVGWKNEKYFSYIALSGLPLRAYHATISIKPKNNKTSLLTWKSFFNTERMSKQEFKEFNSFLNHFYQTSLNKLKKQLEQ